MRDFLVPSRAGLPTLLPVSDPASAIESAPNPPLYERLVRLPQPSSDRILDAFLDYVASKKLELYPAQESAILELIERKNVILNTPTGSGKSLVAAAMHFFSIAQGRKSVYTCPIKALVNEKFLSLCQEFGPQNVGMATGDATVNRDAPILCCTAEILANLALRHGDKTPYSEVIMDEFHYYSDRDRGVAWQTPLLTMSQSRFLLMSATLGQTEFFVRELTRLTGAETALIQSNQRPVPLAFDYSEQPLGETVEALAAANKAPVYLVHFTQNDAVQSAQNFMSLNFCSREEKATISEALHGVKFGSPFGKDLHRFLKHGVGVHHAGLLPKYRILVEQLAQRGLLKIICGTDTLGVGVNVPIRTVLFTQLCKFDGQKTAILSARDFHQIAGRAGRRGFDSQGWVVAQAPEHVIENKKLTQKAERDGKKNAPKRKPPEHNFVGWDEKTFLRLQQASPEPLVSRFQVSHGMLLNVLSREHEDGCRAMQRLIRDSHDSPRAKQAHRDRGWQLFRALVDRKLVEFGPKSAEGRKRLRLNIELQDDFSLNQALSLYLIDTAKLVDPSAPDYHLVLLTLVESILENPEVILRKQLDKAKTQKMAEMKQEGISFEERIAKLEEVEYPKPNREFVYSTFNDFAAKHPWVGEENIRPKSIAREMYENLRSFNDYVKDYELGRAEGVLLRHLSSVYRTLSQTVPDTAKTEPVLEVELYFSTLLEQVDSSLLEEWERLKDPAAALRKAREETAAGGRATVSAARGGATERRADVTRDKVQFTRAVRQRVFGLLGGMISGDLEAALQWLEDSLDAEDVAWNESRLKALMERYHQDHPFICLDPNARNMRFTLIHPDEAGHTWKVEQVLVDPEEVNDWVMIFRVDLAKSKELGKPHLRLLSIGPSAVF
ncbi:MAG: DUF3516 domain-containing protein [Verrucomicrobia bacterium]|nr:DUF3516 domain-containing protein [Verrucomicrobiota bacterium]MBI3869943.1 DUF3516 domain-containing protein [Verrucomicrobiota bacterium]